MIEELLRHIDRLIQQRPACKEALAIYRELVNLMEGIKPSGGDLNLDESYWQVKKKEGFPLFSREDLPVDMKVSAELLMSLLDHLSNKDRQDKEGLKQAVKRSKDEPRWPETLLRAFLKKEDEALTRMENEVSLARGTLEFLAKIALRPALYAIRESVSDRIKKESWDYGYCPVCGSQPDMAFLEKTGKRYLHCELCAEEWAYLRLHCPFCDNQDHKTLGYFEAREEKGFRVDFCRKCQRYIKTLDKRILEDAAPLEVEHLATLHLDILATEQGFR